VPRFPSTLSFSPSLFASFVIPSPLKRNICRQTFFVHVFTQMYIHTYSRYVCTYIHAYGTRICIMYIHACTYIRYHTNIHARIYYIYACVHIMYAHKHTHTHILCNLCVYVCVCVCVCVCVWMRMYFSCFCGLVPRFFVLVPPMLLGCR